MQVLIVSHYLPPHIGGLERFISQEVAGVLDRGHKVVVAGLVTDGQGAPLCAHPNLTILGLRCWNGLERWGIPYPIPSLGAVVALYRAVYAADVVHGHGGVFAPTAFAIVFAWWRGKALLVTDYTTYRFWVLRWIAYAWSAFYTRLCVRFSSDNAAVLARLVKVSNRPKAACFLPFPVEKDLFRPLPQLEREALRRELGWDDGRPKVLFVGRLLPHKGLALILECQDPSFDLVFCGPASPRMARALSRPGVQMLAPRPHSMIASLYQAADALVIASSREGFPVSAREALACGLPVVLTALAGYEPYLKIPGLVVVERSGGALRSALRKVLAQSREHGEGHCHPSVDPSLHEWTDELYGGLLIGPRDNGRGLPRQTLVQFI